jgi:hypothetical protein
MAKQYQMKKRMELLGLGLIINGKKWLLFFATLLNSPAFYEFSFLPQTWKF